MKAAVFTGPKTIEIKNTEKPSVGDGEVLLKIYKVGICGTDLGIYTGKRKVKTPLILGHEFVGDVVEVGKKVKTVKVGDKATAEHVMGCGKCVYCTRDNKKNLCVDRQVYGITRAGALQEYMAIPQELVYVLPKGMTMDEGVLIEPLSIAVYAVKKVVLQKQDTVGVIGQGAIGLFLDAVLQAKDCTVLGLDILDERLAYARKHKLIDHSINTKTGVVEELEKLELANSIKVVFEAAGIEPTANLALDIVKKNGSIVLIGLYGKPVSINLMSAIKKEVSMIGSMTCINVFDETIELMQSGKIHTKNFITHRYPIDKVKEAFEDAIHKPEERIKTVIEF